jgi:hypothetical protein
MLAFYISITYNYIIMKFKNYWLLKKEEKSILKIVHWSQRNKIKVESLTKKEMLCALKEEK